MRERTSFWRLEGWGSRSRADAHSNSIYSKHSAHFSNAGESLESNFKCEFSRRSCRLPLEPKLYPPPKRRKITPTSIQLPSSSSKAPGPTLWTKKYAPACRSEIAGNQNVILHLFKWLETWENLKTTSGFKRGVLITGPPGVGKSSAAVAACGELKYSSVLVDGQALRNRSFSSLRLSNRSLTLESSGLSLSKKTALIVELMDDMDEASAESFSEFLKRSRVPVICICNDRFNKSIRKLIGSCMELTFRKPKLNEILKLLELVQKKEKLLMDKEFLKFLVENGQRDVRQVLLQLQYFSTTRTSSSSGRLDSKDVSLSSFASTDCLFAEQGSSNCQPLETRISLVLQDFDFVSLLVQENYVNYKPAKLRKEAFIMDSISKASEYLCFGDVLSRSMHQHQRWELTNLVSAALALTCSSILQGRRHSFDTHSQTLRFPSWLSNRRQTKGELYKSYVGEFSSHVHKLQPSKVEVVGSDKVPISNNSDLELFSILRRRPTR